MTDVANIEHQLVCSHAEFEAQRGEPAFSRILTLARIANTIRFNQYAIVTPGAADSPAGVRQSSSAMFYMGALLWEAFRFADRLGEHFRDFAAFREDFVPLLRNPEIVELRAGLLDRLRNQAVYHHDDAVIPAGLSLMHGDEYVLLSTRGTTRRETYYDLADIAVMHFALPQVRTIDEFLVETSNALQSIARISSAFAAAADRLILEYSKTAGWKHRATHQS